MQQVLPVRYRDPSRWLQTSKTGQKINTRFVVLARSDTRITVGSAVFGIFGLESCPAPGARGFFDFLHHVSICFSFNAEPEISGRRCFRPTVRLRARGIRRQADGSVTAYGFNYDAFVSGTAPGSNGLLEPNDTVVVPD